MKKKKKNGNKKQKKKHIIGHFDELNFHLSNRQKRGVDLSPCSSPINHLPFLGLMPQNGPNGLSVLLREHKCLDISHHLA